MEETIAAIATAYGEGGIGIIRISGENALDILNQVFVPFKENKIKERKLTYGHIKDKEETIDEVMAVYMKAPHTYTREDVVEINCHGSIVSLRKTLALVLAKGARIAEPGEFTKRAFLNGRLDLIKARTDKGFDVALKQLDGSFSDEIKSIRKDLIDILVNVTVNIDYPDEDIEQLTYSKLKDDLQAVKASLEKIISTADRGKIIKEGLNVAIIGRPNVGKSSLMNALLRETRAIVTEIPGTTRDTIQEQMSIRGIPVLLTDTAGIRETEDTIERIGIEKSKESFNKADLVIFIIDGSEKISSEDKALMEYVDNRPCITLINKTDKGTAADEEEIKEKIPQAQVIYTSVLNGEGITEIEEAIENMVYGGQAKQQDSLGVTNVRHEELLRQAVSAIADALEMTDMMQPLEFIEVDINRSYELLGEIIGETVADDIINEVFARFCLGK